MGFIQGRGRVGPLKQNVTYQFNEWKNDHYTKYDI